jgi:uncharacterized RmlC-like cupin family protein
MEKRVARFKALKPSPKTFIDQALPEYEREIFNIIGRGVSEEKDASAAITAVEGFNVQMARAKPGKGNALHAHATVECFMPLNGRWKIMWGERGENEVVLEQFDLISIPPGVMRAFRNVGDDEASLLAILGGTDAGHVKWSPELLGRAKDARGWALDAEGNLLTERQRS